MKLISINKVKDGRFLKNYELLYLNKEGKEKKYEMVSRSELTTPYDLGVKVAGVAIFAKHKTLDQILLLEEFRMAINKTVINVVSGMLDEGESIEECIKREIFEETGLTDVVIDRISKPAYSAVGMSDERVILAHVTVDGPLSTDNTSANEMLKPRFCSREEVEVMLDCKEFASRTQILCESWLYNE